MVSFLSDDDDDAAAGGGFCELDDMLRRWRSSEVVWFRLVVIVLLLPGIDFGNIPAEDNDESIDSTSLRMCNSSCA